VLHLTWIELDHDIVISILRATIKCPVLQVEGAVSIFIIICNTHIRLCLRLLGAVGESYKAFHIILINGRDELCELGEGDSIELSSAMGAGDEPLGN